MLFALEDVAPQLDVVVQAPPLISKYFETYHVETLSFRSNPGLVLVGLIFFAAARKIENLINEARAQPREDRYITFAKYQVAILESLRKYKGHALRSALVKTLNDEDAGERILWQAYHYEQALQLLICVGSSRTGRDKIKKTLTDEQLKQCNVVRDELIKAAKDLGAEEVLFKLEQKKDKFELDPFVWYWSCKETKVAFEKHQIKLNLSPSTKIYFSDTGSTTGSNESSHLVAVAFEVDDIPARHNYPARGWEAFEEFTSDICLDLYFDPFIDHESRAAAEYIQSSDCGFKPRDSLTEKITFGGTSRLSGKQFAPFV